MEEKRQYVIGDRQVGGPPVHAEAGLPSYLEATSRQTPRQSTDRSSCLTERSSIQPLTPRSIVTNGPSSKNVQPRSKGTTILLRLSPCLLVPLVVLVVGGTVFGFLFVDDYSNPQPSPHSSPDAIQDDRNLFLIFTAVFGVGAYVSTFAFFLVFAPRLFGRLRLPCYARDKATPSPRFRPLCVGLCTLLSLLYFALVAVSIWFTLYYADVKLNKKLNNAVSQKWIGTALILGPPSSYSANVAASLGVLYDQSGTYQLGQASFTQYQDKWQLQISSTKNEPSPIFTTIVYFNQTDSIPITFNASGPGTPDSFGNEVYGGLSQVSHPIDNMLEYESPVNLEIVYSTPNILNITGQQTQIWSSSAGYQGVGGAFAPLGTWYVNNDPAIQVIWAGSGVDRVCDELRIEMAAKYEGVAWILVGFVWEWWVAWGLQGYCDWN